jgi:hypothetical protein
VLPLRSASWIPVARTAPLSQESSVPTDVQVVSAWAGGVAENIAATPRRPATVHRTKVIVDIRCSLIFRFAGADAEIMHMSRQGTWIVSVGEIRCQMCPKMCFQLSQ